MIKYQYIIIEKYFYAIMIICILLILLNLSLSLKKIIKMLKIFALKLKILKISYFSKYIKEDTFLFK